MTEVSDTTSILDDQQIASDAGRWLTENKLLLASVESCTGGGIAQLITDIPGSSAWFERGFVTYSNLAKQQLVGVDENLIIQYGAVSEFVAAAMASGGLQNSAANICISVTGIAGPDGGSPEKPVGTVCFGRAMFDRVDTHTHLFSGNRLQIRRAAIQYALTHCLMNKF